LKNDLSQLILLQKLDTDIRQLREEIESLPQRQAVLEEQFAASVAEYLALRRSLEEALTRRGELEVRTETEQQRHLKFKADLMKSTNEREYTTAVREIDISRKMIATLESETLKLMEQIEKLEAEVAARTPDMEVRRVEVDRQLESLRTRATDAATEVEALLGQRPDLYGSLSPDARSNYDRLSRMRSGLALAEARNYSCLGCRMSLRPQVFNDIRRGEQVITCENCGRILYFNESVTA
jgi:predicted  nucleic acid-binding Zn-ribbon protein